MKRIIKLLLITILAFPFMVKADMGAPQLKSFEAIVTKEGGVDVYSFEGGSYKPNGKLEYGQVIKVTWEDDDGYYSYETNDGKSGVVKKDGISPKVEEVTPNSEGISKVDKEFKAIVNQEGGIDVYKGPSKLYGVAGHLNKGTEFVVKYYADDDSSYVYVDHNGVKGWVNGYKSSLLFESKLYYIFTKDVKLGKVTIPKDTILKPSWITDIWGTQSELGTHAIFNYKNEEGILDIHKNDDIVSIPEEIQVYKTKKLIKTYNNPPESPSAKMDGKINAEKEFYLIGSEGNIDAAYVILKDTKEGTWIIFDEDELEKVEKADISSLIKASSDEPTTEPTTTQVIEESSNDNGNFLSKFSNTELIIISASVGIILSLTSIVCVVLVNKKKKNKPLETVESLQPVSQDQPSYINNDNNQ